MLGLRVLGGQRYRGVGDNVFVGRSRHLVKNTQLISQIYFCSLGSFTYYIHWVI